MSERDIYDFDPSTVSASIEILPKDEYEFQVGEPKAFLNNPKQQPDGTTKAASFGIRFPLTVTRSANHPETIGKKIFLQGFMHTPGSQAMTKGFVMAAAGYHNKPEEEKEFNEATKNMDWKFHPPTGAVGEVYSSIVGNRVVGDVDTQPRKDDKGQVVEGEFNQNFRGWHPVADGFKAERNGK